MNLKSQCESGGREQEAALIGEQPRIRIVIEQPIRELSSNSVSFDDKQMLTEDDL